jgi:chemotaxis protein MotA
VDLGTVIGLLVATIGILGGFVIEGGAVAGLFNIPGLMIVVVGTLGATMVAFPLGQILKIGMVEVDDAQLAA